MKITKEIRDLSEVELQNRAAELKQELFLTLLFHQE